MYHKIGRYSAGGWLVLALLTLPARAAAADQSKSWVDRERFPEAHSILTSDRVMFPDDVSDWPLKIDASRQLFIDDFLMSEIENFPREFHQPLKHPEPLMCGGYANVLYDEGIGLFQMWNRERYLTSRDGIDWQAAGSVPVGYVIYNPDIPEEEGRYKSIAERRAEPGTEEEEPGGF